MLANYDQGSAVNIQSSLPNRQVVTLCTQQFLHLEYSMMHAVLLHAWKPSKRVLASFLDMATSVRFVQVYQM